MGQTSPGGVGTRISVWLKANNGVTLTPGNKVDVWQEMSGANVTGNFRTQPTQTSAPTQTPPGFLPNGINFNPYVVFDNTGPNSVLSDSVFTAGSLMDNDSNMIIQVIRLHSQTSTGVWFKWEPSVTGAPRMGMETNPPGNAGRIRFDFAGTTSCGTANVNERHVLNTLGIQSASTRTNRLNGTPDPLVTSSGSISFSPPTTKHPLIVGNNYYSDAYPTKIDIAELIVYKRGLNAAEINRVESYLALKYGVTLDQTLAVNNYTASNGTTIFWTRTAMAPYNQNITGIGRDDASGLMQKQSRSINDKAMVNIYHSTYAGPLPDVNANNNNNIAADMNFVVYGDNGADSTLKICALNGRAIRMARTWKVQKTGTIADVTLALNKAQVSSDIRYLMVSSNPAFPDASTTFIRMNDNGNFLTGATTLNNNDYFTFSSDTVKPNPTITNARCDADNGSIVLNVSGAPAPIDYSWTHDITLIQPAATGLAPGTYGVTIRYGVFPGCTTNYVFEVGRDIQPLQLQPVTKDVTCNKGTDGSIKINSANAVLPIQVTMNGTYLGNTNPITDLRAGTYVIQVKDTDGCIGNATVTINQPAKPIGLNVVTEADNCEKGQGSGTARVEVYDAVAPYKYEWSKDPSWNEDNIKELSAGDYGIIVTDAKGCKAQQSFEVDYVPCCHAVVPSAFSPNKDGKNDILRPMFDGEMELKSFAIYNRFGERIFETGNANTGWDGEGFDIGVYFYQLKYSCKYGKKEIFIKGDVTLIR